jgi:hypothetical protein
MNIETKVYQWMETHARPLEFAQYKYLFKNGSKDVMYNQLSRFQTESGGFAFGLEPDNLNAHPQAIQTWAAIPYILDLELTEADPMVKKTLDYLMNTMDDKGFYPATIPSNNNVPHAVWWNFDKEHNYWGYNPSIALWAFIYKYRKGLKIKRLIVDAFTSFIDNPSEEMHELRCFVDAYEWLYKDRDDFLSFNLFEETLKNQVLNIVKSNEDKNKDSYGPSALTFIESPKSLLYCVLRPYVAKEIKSLINEIEEKEMWDITFHWQQYESHFVKARVIWQSILAVKYLRFLVK